MNKRTMIFIRCCYGYAISGMSVLVIGAILPSIMREASLSYSVAGGLLSMMAVGNLLASFFFPIFVNKGGKRLAVTVFAAMVPVCIFGMTRLPSAGIMYALMFVAGVSRGAITIINNTTVNIITNNSGKYINLLHCSFAVGAFLAPFLTALLVRMGLGWRSVMYLIMILCASSAISYATMDYEESVTRSKVTKRAQKEYGFIKHPLFYCIGFLLFFYLGIENCINGWFVTYLQSTGVMSETYATTMVSVTWLVIMLGRMVCAALLKRYSMSMLILTNGIGSCICFFILVSSSHLATITAALLGMGFFLAGIYPTCIACVGKYTMGSTTGMSLLTAISALGGIITPQLVGSAADRMGIVTAVGLLGINVVLVVTLGGIHYIKTRGSEN